MTIRVAGHGGFGVAEVALHYEDALAPRDPDARVTMPQIMRMEVRDAGGLARAAHRLARHARAARRSSRGHASASDHPQSYGEPYEQAR